MITDYDILKDALNNNAEAWSDRPLHLDHFKIIVKLQGKNIEFY